MKDCLGYALVFSIAMMKHHNQDSLPKKGFILLTILEKIDLFMSDALQLPDMVAGTEY